MSWESPQKYFRGLNLTELGIDKAYLNISWRGDYPAWFYTLNEDCDKCPWQRVGEINESILLDVSTHHTTHLLARRSGFEEYIRTDAKLLESTVICQKSVLLEEFGVYQFDVDNCRVDTLLEPVNANLAILVCFLVYLALAATSFGLKYVPGNPLHKVEVWLGWREAGDKRGPGKQRLRSLDTFRGMTIALMIFVNDGGGGYYFFEHATWNGLYVADLVFPWFLWIMGVCIPMSVKSNIRKKVPFLSVLWGITVRSVKLFLLGFILNTLGGWIDLSKLRVPGVLQRFGVCYFVVALIGNLFSKPRDSDAKPRWYSYTDILSLGQHWAVFLGLLLIHQLVFCLVPATDCSQGYSGPGGLHDWSPERNNSGCIGGITGYIDKEFFSLAHIYGNPTAKGVYSSSEFDPEGILSSLTSIFQVWLGYQAGYILEVYSDSKQRVGRWLLWSAFTGGLGCLLCGGQQNGGWVPLNKNLWSISFVLVTTSFAFCLLALLYVIIDAKQWWKGQPFFYAGMNSILLYCGHSVGYSIFPWHFTAGEMRTHAARLPEALWGTTLWIFISFLMYKKKIFVTV